MESTKSAPKQLLDLPDELLLDIVEHAVLSNLEETNNPAATPNNTSSRVVLGASARSGYFGHWTYDPIEKILDCAGEAAMDNYDDRYTNEIKRFLGVSWKLFGMAEEVVSKAKYSRTLTIFMQRFTCWGVRSRLSMKGDLGNSAPIYRTTTELRLRLSAGGTGHWATRRNQQMVLDVATRVLMKCHAVRVLNVKLDPGCPDSWHNEARQAMTTAVQQMQTTFGHAITLQIV